MSSEQQYNYNNNNNDNMKETRDPKWILDRRNSGRPFWRRDSGGSFACSDTDESSRRNRVKFRCDVEVLEFWKQEYEQSQSSSSSSSSSSDEYSDEDDCYGFRSQEKWRSKQPWRSKPDADLPTPSTFVIGVLLAACIVVFVYQWISDAVSVAA